MTCNRVTCFGMTFSFEATNPTTKQSKMPKCRGFSEFRI